MFFFSEIMHMLPRELARQKKAGGLGGAQPPHLHGSDVARG